MSANCRCCNSPETTCVGSKKGTASPDLFTYYTCKNCGLLFVEPVLGPEIYDDAYYRGEGVDPHVNYEEEYRDYRSTDRMLEFVDLSNIAGKYFSSRTISGPLVWMDFGCGAGGLLSFLKDNGIKPAKDLKLMGHDVGSYAGLLRNKGFTILSPEEMELMPSNSCDIVSLIEVIEHLPNPSHAIELASRLLKPGGLLLLTTGNLASPMAKLQGIDYRYCTPEIHVSLFTPQSLSALYRRYGLIPLNVRYQGTIKFKSLKNLSGNPLRPLASSVLRFPPVVRIVDFLFGVSAMPCATKPV